MSKKSRERRKGKNDQIRADKKVKRAIEVKKKLAKAAERFKKAHPEAKGGYGKYHNPTYPSSKPVESPRNAEQIFVGNQTAHL